ncbi:hypothetical protein L218DRAFT_1027765 [Marasmius fiardii PR-910]|nr:hypothetical protein L218DRAFT_1027765 [Marasmius fiardii PR-910]
MITVYDLGPSNFPEHLGCSPHTRRVIFALNYKKLPYKYSVVRFEDVEPTAKSVNAPPTTAKPDGSPKYTVPFIHDSSTGQSVSDSLAIVEYLDQTYPATPRLVPEGTRVLQVVFTDSVSAKFYVLSGVLTPKYQQCFSAEFLAAVEKQFGPPRKPPSEEEVKELWAKGRKSFDELTAAYDGTTAGSEVFVMGEKPVFADLALAAAAAHVKFLFGDDSEEWKDVSSWIGGRVGRMVEAILKYERM